MKYIFIVNPIAGRKDSTLRIKKMIERTPYESDCIVLRTSRQGDAVRLVREWAEKYKDEHIRFIACGGDGTINEVFTGAVGLEDVSVSIYPCGSGNDFIKCFGGKKTFSDVRSLIEADTIKLDLLKVGERYSVNAVNFGFDTAVATYVQEQRRKRGHGGKFLYFLGCISALGKKIRTPVRVEADGELLNPLGSVTSVTICNGRYVGGSFNCAPKAKVDDGLIEVCVLKKLNVLNFLFHALPYTFGRHIDNPFFDKWMEYRQARNVSISAPRGFAFSLDGEIVETMKMDIEVLHNVLELAVPER